MTARLPRRAGARPATGGRGHLRPEPLAYALVRVTLGLVFALFGLAKLAAGRAAFTAHVDESFASTPLPHVAVHLFGTVLPFAEVGLGACVALGLCTTLGLTLIGVLLLALTAGKAMVQDTETVAHNLVYVLLVFELLTRAEHNCLALDRVWQRRH